MASTNKTTNYELSQFIETDRPAWLTDYNGDMRTIDSTMKAISDVASGASGSISELADRMSTAEGNITTNANDINALEARADALEAQAQSTAGTIAGIQTEQTAQNLGIEAATELGYNLARPYDSASTYAVGDYVLFQNTLYKCIVAVPVGEAFDATKWLAIKATDEIASGGAPIPQYITLADDPSDTEKMFTLLNRALYVTKSDGSAGNIAPSNLAIRRSLFNYIIYGKLIFFNIMTQIYFDAFNPYSNFSALHVDATLKFNPANPNYTLFKRIKDCIEDMPTIIAPYPFGKPGDSTKWSNINETVTISSTTILTTPTTTGTFDHFTVGGTLIGIIE